MVGDINNNIGLPLFAIIFLVAVFLVIVHHFTGVDFGAIGILSWIIVIVGALGFVVYVIGCARGEY